MHLQKTKEQSTCELGSVSIQVGEQQSHCKLGKSTINQCSHKHKKHNNNQPLQPVAAQQETY